MQTWDASDDQQLWEACRELPSDFEPYGKRKWPGEREARPDCATCSWFVELSRAWPDWGACANPRSPRAGLLTFREQGCWQHEPEEERSREATCPARCDLMRGFEKFLREQAADYIRDEVRKANELVPDEDPPAPTPGRIRQALFAMVRRLLEHADEDFRRQAFDETVARVRWDSRRHWQFSRFHWARTAGEAVSGIRLPGNMRELEDGFWRRADAAISEALDGREPRPAKKKRKRAG